MAEIVLNNVSKSFGAVPVIESLSLSARAGEFMVLLGPSGSGKTTILRMIAGLETIDSGSLEIGGQKCEHTPPGQRNVAMVFQNYALYPHMTVAENLAFGLQNIGVAAADIATRVQSAAHMLEIEPLLLRRPAQLSGGQRQRVAIGRAIVKNPKAFLFDEPLSNLDAALRVRTRVELAELHQRLKTTTIYVTHDQTEAMTLADRIVVLNDRKIEQVGTPMEIYHAPATRFVAGFVGSPAMNFMKIKISGKGKAQKVTTEGGKLLNFPAVAAAEGSYELGLRPEAIHAVEGAGDLDGQITVVERLGDRTMLHVRLMDGTVIVAQDKGRSTASNGSAISLRFDTGQIHLFDGTGKSVAVKAAGKHDS